MRVVKGEEGSRSRFTENKTVLSQFTKNKDIMKITVHGKLNICFSENNFSKSRFTATMEITIHEQKISHFTFHGEKRADHESRQYPLPLSKMASPFAPGQTKKFHNKRESCSRKTRRRRNPFG